MSAKLVNKTVKELFIYVALIFVLLLTFINIDSYLSPKKIMVLGAETQNSNENFWQDLLSKNPNYIPALVETGKIEAARLIDPNNERVINY